MNNRNIVDVALENLTDNLSIYTKNAAIELAFLLQHREFLLELGKIPSSYGASTYFYGLTHEQVIACVKHFGVKFDKTYSDTKVTYKGEHTFGSVYLSDSEPPENCRIIEEEVDVPEQIIPAHKEKKRRIECKPNSSELSLNPESPSNPDAVPANADTATEVSPAPDSIAPPPASETIPDRCDVISPREEF